MKLEEQVYLWFSWNEMCMNQWCGDCSLKASPNCYTVQICCVKCASFFNQSVVFCVLFLFLKKCSSAFTVMST